MKSALFLSLVLMATTSVSMAQNYETITQEQINQLAAASSTKVSYSSMTQKGRSVMLGIGNCITSTDPNTHYVTSTATIGRCEELYQTQLVTIDPKGMFNEKTYIVAGSQKRIGVRKTFENEVLSQDTSGFIDYINNNQRSNLDNAISQMNAQYTCSSISKRIDSSNAAYTAEQKQIISECFGL